jgi:hypothetical protein
MPFLFGHPQFAFLDAPQDTKPNIMIKNITNTVWFNLDRFM